MGEKVRIYLVEISINTKVVNKTEKLLQREM